MSSGLHEILFIINWDKPEKKKNLHILFSTKHIKVKLFLKENSYNPNLDKEKVQLNKMKNKMKETKF